MTSKSSFFSTAPEDYTEDNPTGPDVEQFPNTPNTKSPSSFYNQSGGVLNAIDMTGVAEVAANAAAAAASAAAALVSQTAAAASDTDAQTQASNASASATAASGSAGSAATSATNAATSASNAATYSNSAGNSAATATTQATNAASSATAAGSSATNAASSATSASSSASTASTQATNAASSATSASSSASAAAASAALFTAAQAANVVLAGPTTGSNAAPTFRALVGADLPNPGASSLGGIQSVAAVSHKWISTISTGGVSTLSQPAFTDISGSASASQLPTPTSTTIGGVKSNSVTLNSFIASINTDGSITIGQPAFSGISGNIATTQMNSGTGASSSTFWRGDNTWATPTATASSITVGTTGVSSGTSGDLLADSSGTLAAVGLNQGIQLSGGNVGRALNEVTLDNTASNPTGTTSTTAVMMGLGSGWTLTPAYCTRIRVVITGVILNGSTTIVSEAQGYYGTGSAPGNGVAVTGTQFGGTAQVLNSARCTVAISAIITGLTAGTKYWFDFALFSSTTGITTSVLNPHISAYEF